MLASKFKEPKIIIILKDAIEQLSKLAVISNISTVSSHNYENITNSLKIAITEAYKHFIKPRCPFEEKFYICSLFVLLNAFSFSFGSHPLFLMFSSVVPGQTLRAEPNGIN